MCVEEDNYITKIVDDKIEKINDNLNVYDVGTVTSVKDFLLKIDGMDHVMFYEKINISDKAIGYVNSIQDNFVTVALVEVHCPINVGDMAYSTNTLFQGKYSNEAFGRIINIFGVDILSSKKFSSLIDIPIERPTIAIMDRKSVNRPLETGITGIDMLYPIGKGQRQLIIGDKRTGKTQILLDTIQIV